MKKSLYVLLVAFMSIFLLSACMQENGKDNQKEGEQQAEKKEEKTPVEEKEVLLHNSKGDQVGTAQLEDSDDGVIISIKAKDLPPGKHGFHIHEAGRCEPPTFETAGGHFNPTNAKHGMEQEDGPHAGDLPNIVVDEDGKVDATFNAEGVTLNGDKENSLLGKEGTALVIHEKEDDGKTQPTGDAGGRLVCGEINN